jgi:hypothetical protein
MKDHWENDEKMMRENTREPVVSFLILPGVHEFAEALTRQNEVHAYMEQLMSQVKIESDKLDAIMMNPGRTRDDAEERAVLRQYEILQHEIYTVCRPELRKLSRYMTVLAGMFIHCSLFPRE